MQRPRSLPTLFLSCWSNTLLWNVRMSPVLSPFLPTSTVVSVSACSMTWIVLVDRSVELPAELPPHPQARPTVSTMAQTATQTLIPLVPFSRSAYVIGTLGHPHDHAHRRAPWTT